MRNLTVQYLLKKAEREYLEDSGVREDPRRARTSRVLVAVLAIAGAAIAVSAFSGCATDAEAHAAKYCPPAPVCPPPVQCPPLSLPKCSADILHRKVPAGDGHLECEETETGLRWEQK